MTVRLLPVAAVLGFAAAPAFASNQIVVRSTGPSAKAYPVGQQMPAGVKVSLRAGDRLTILGPRRATILQGPGSFEIAAANDTARFRRTRFSSLRGPAGVRGPWALDVDRSGRVCFTPKEKLSLWRSASYSDATVMISGAGLSPVALRWPAGRQTLTWPAELPIREGLTYRVHIGGRLAPTEWKMAAIGPWQLDRAAAAEMLLQYGCKEQLDQLVERALWEN